VTVPYNTFHCPPVPHERVQADQIKKIIFKVELIRKWATNKMMRPRLRLTLVQEAVRETRSLS
jgi:hypothetical protein